MQSFALPEFYVPWPARQNPHLEAARIHSKAWAREIGILEDDGIWSESTFDRHDYALFCAYIFPETTAPELKLLTDWNVWAFYVDDYFLHVYKQKNDHVGAKQYLDRVLLFMPINLGPSPMPETPTESGLADLWQRSAPMKSPTWRARIVESTRILLEASATELQQRIANPIEYIEMRRNVGGALWSADLVEHATFVEIPQRIVNTRPMRVLKDTFADAVHLRNDIFSYEREILKEGELTNGVLVVERFLEVDTQQSVDLVNKLLTSRLQQFEHTVFTELLPMFQEYALDPAEQVSVLTYIRGLQDWQSGAHEWHIQTSRYLNPTATDQTSNRIPIPAVSGLDRAALRITTNNLRLSANRLKNYRHIPHKKVGPTPIPDFYMPFTTEINPHLETARKTAKAWARQMGMFDPLPNHPDITLWDEHRFDVTDQVFFNALLRPTASPAWLDLMICWNVWGMYTDDYFSELFGRTHDLISAKICHARLSMFMPIKPDAPAPEPLNPVERGLATVWEYSTQVMSIDEQHLFRKVVNEMIGSWVWEISNQIQNRIPDLIDYVEMRRKTSGSDFVMMRPRSTNSLGIPPEIYRSLTMQELHKAAVDCVCWTNDIFSYQKEIEFEGDIHNALLVIENFLSCDKIQAINILNKLINARIKQFQHIATNELPILCKDFDLDSDAREILNTYVVELQQFMCAALRWHLKTSRYDENEFRRTSKPLSLKSRPSGFGTSATHILDTIGSRGVAVQPQGAMPVKTERTYASTHHTLPFARKV